MSGRRRGGSGVRVVTAVLALGCCLLAAPAAHADFDDLLDTVIGAAAAGTDVDLAGVPVDAVDFGDLGGVLQDPLGQLDQVLHDAPGYPDTPADTGTPGDTGAPADGAPADGSPETGTGAEHHSEDGSGRLPSIPKFSMPSSGSGSGGNGGGSGGNGGGSGGSGGGAPRAKANTSATHGTPAATPTLLPEPAAVP